MTPWLRQLGFRAAEARDAARYCNGLGDLTLEERLKAALRYLAPVRGVQRIEPTAGSRDDSERRIAGKAASLSAPGAPAAGSLGLSSPGAMAAGAG